MSKEIDSIIEEMANKLSAAVKKAAGPTTGDSDQAAEKGGDTESKISVGTKDPAQAAKNLAAKSEELRLQHQLNQAYMDFAEQKDSLIDLHEHEQRIMDAKAKAAAELAINDSEANRAAMAALDSELAKLKQILDPQRKKLQNLEKMSKANKELKSSSDQYFDSLAKKVGLSTNMAGTLVGKFLKFTNLFTAKGGAITFFKSLGTALLTLPLSIIDSIVNTTIQMIIGMDKAASGFSAATGMGQKYRKELIQMRIENTRLGISAEESSKSFQALIRGLGNTSMMSAKTVKSLAQTAASLNKVGASLDNTAKAFHFFNKIAGETPEIAENITKKIFMMGTSIDISVDQMSKSFVAAIPKLAVYGGKAEGIFLKLAAAAKAANVDVKSLLDVAGKFDTFAGAAEAAGKLNAILGTQISTTSMIQMTEEERVETIIQQIQLGGRSFKDLDRYTQKAIAASVGITDMAEANNIFGMSMAEYQQYQIEMQKQEDSTKKLNDAIKEAQPIMDKLKIAFSELFVANEDFVMSLMDGTKEVVDWIKENKEMIKTGLKWYAILRISMPVMAAMTFVWRGLTGIVNLFRFALVKEAVQQQTNNVIKAQTVIVNRSVGTSSRFAAKGIMVMGAAIGLALLGAGALVGGIASLANALKDMSSEEIANLKDILIGVATGLGVLMVVLGVAAAAMTGPQLLALLGIAGAMFLIGSAVGAAAAGIGVFATGAAELAKTGSDGALAVLGLTIALVGMIWAIGALGPVAAGVTGLIIGIGGALFLMGLAVKMAAPGMEQFMEGMNKAGPGVGEAAAAMAELGFAMFLFAGAAALIGIPPAIIGAKILLGVVASVAAGAVAMAAYMQYQAEYIKNISETMDIINTIQIDQAALSISKIAQAIREIDNALGSGDRRLQITSTLENLSDLSQVRSGARVTSLVTKASTSMSANASRSLTSSRSSETLNAEKIGKIIANQIRKSANEGKYEFELQIGDEQFATKVVKAVHKHGRAG